MVESGTQLVRVREVMTEVVKGEAATRRMELLVIEARGWRSTTLSIDGSQRRRGEGKTRTWTWTGGAEGEREAPRWGARVLWRRGGRGRTG